MEIKEIRRQSGLSQHEFSVETGVPVATIRNWEQGRTHAPDYVVSMIKENLMFKGYVITENRADSIDEIKTVVSPIAKKYGIKKVVLFGSRARGDYDGKSDYDFFVKKDKSMGLSYFGFIEDLKEAFSSSVDVVSQISEDSQYLRDAIDKEGVVIYEG